MSEFNADPQFYKIRYIEYGLFLEDFYMCVWVCKYKK